MNVIQCEKKMFFLTPMNGGIVTYQWYIDAIVTYNDTNYIRLYSMIPIRPIKIGKPTLDTGTDCWIGSIASIAWFPHTATSPPSCDEEAKAETLWMFNRSKSLLD